MKLLAGALGVLAAGLVAMETVPVQEQTEWVLTSIADEVEVWHAEHGSYPSAAPSQLGTDPWGNAIRYYRVPGGGFMLVSLGADGAPGGAGDAADLVVYRVAQP